MVPGAARPASGYATFHPVPGAAGQTGTPQAPPGGGKGMKALKTTGSVLGTLLSILAWLLDSVMTVIYHALWIAIGVAGVWMGVSGFPIGFVAPVISFLILLLYWTTGWMIWWD